MMKRQSIPKTNNRNQCIFPKKSPPLTGLYSAELFAVQWMEGKFRNEKIRLNGLICDRECIVCPSWRECYLHTTHHQSEPRSCQAPTGNSCKNRVWYWPWWKDGECGRPGLRSPPCQVDLLVADNELSSHIPLPSDVQKDHDTDFVGSTESFLKAVVSLLGLGRTRESMVVLKIPSQLGVVILTTLATRGSSHCAGCWDEAVFWLCDRWMWVHDWFGEKLFIVGLCGADPGHINITDASDNSISWWSWCSGEALKRRRWVWRRDSLRREVLWSQSRPLKIFPDSKITPNDFEWFGNEWVTSLATQSRHLPSRVSGQHQTVRGLSFLHGYISDAGKHTVSFVVQNSRFIDLKSGLHGRWIYPTDGSIRQALSHEVCFSISRNWTWRPIKRPPLKTPMTGCNCPSTTATSIVSASLFTVKRCYRFGDATSLISCM